MVHCHYRIATEIDIVLLSHAGLEYCGALPFAVAKVGGLGLCKVCPRFRITAVCLPQLGLTTNIYCTLPVQRMGQVCRLLCCVPPSCADAPLPPSLAQVAVTDAYIAASQCREVNTFNLLDVERVFGNIKPVRYQQDLEFRCVDCGSLACCSVPPRCCPVFVVSGVKISAFRAGRTIGGSIWRMHKLLVCRVCVFKFPGRALTVLVRGMVLSAGGHRVRCGL
jgi:Cft2 family RNA processing exonuclease